MNAAEAAGGAGEATEGAAAAARADLLRAARRFCTAPMMSYSHKHARRLWRFLCPPALIYTEMLMCDALICGRRAHLLDAPPPPSPVALQLGGADARRMAQAARIGAEAGYDEVNINCGCPSPRVKKAAFGACLMLSPALVADMVAAMRAAVPAAVAVTVKCRLAVDGMDAEEGLDAFARAVAAAGCDVLVVHARRAWLNGLNPAQNRTVPPLDYARARRLKAGLVEDGVAMAVVVNGGVSGLEEAAGHLAWADGVMLGRAVCRDPFLLARAGRRFFGAGAADGEGRAAAPDKRAALEFMREYVAELPERERRWALSATCGLFYGEANGRRYRQMLAAGAVPEWDEGLEDVGAAAA